MDCREVPCPTTFQPIQEAPERRPRLTEALCCRACLRMAALLSLVKAALFLRSSL